MDSVRRKAWNHGRIAPVKVTVGLRAARVGPPLLPLLVVGLLWGLPGQSEPKRYDPDQATCQGEAIRRAYQANMLPWQDQPAVVLERLGQLQAAMTLDTLRECQAKGLMTPNQAASLEAELGLKTTSASSPDAQTPPQSPTRP